MNRKGSSHLSLDDRTIISQMLKDGCLCKDIAARIGKDERTVSYEVKNRRYSVQNGRYGLNNKFDNATCKTIIRFPFVCDACKKRSSCCKQLKFTYDARTADEAYRMILSQSRVGLDLTETEFAVLNEAVKAGTGNKQSIHHIVETAPEKLPCSERQIYRLISNGQLETKPLNLIRAVKLKPRVHNAPKVDKRKVRDGRRYSDYVAYMAQHPGAVMAQTDTVMGTQSNTKSLLTIHFTIIHFMLIYVLEKHDMESVTKVFAHIQKTLGLDLYSGFFEVVLTDNGSEFLNPQGIELFLDTDVQAAHLFYCDAYVPGQKGAIEENHEFIRYIIPKGTNFDWLTQSQADLMASHINNLHRRSLGSTPYELAKMLLGTDVLQLLNQRYIPPEEVLLKPSLLTK